MRLTCPNCGAQYEVPDQVIPVDGRDVQCSNCGNTWFQSHPDAPDLAEDQQQEQEWDAPEDLHDEAHDAPEAPEDEAESPQAEQDHAEQDYAEQDWPDENLSDDNWPDEDDPDLPEQDPPDQPPRSQFVHDSSVTDVLRQEAEREAQLRAQEQPDPLESQPELGLDHHADDAERRAEEARARMARLRGQEPEDEAYAQSHPADPEPDSRRDLLPDIEEINSSLKSSGNAVAPTTPAPLPGAEPAPRKSRFSLGFAIAVLLMTALLMIYTNAQAISAAVPQVDPALNLLVAFVDNARLWLDQKMVQLTPSAQ